MYSSRKQKQIENILNNKIIKKIDLKKKIGPHLPMDRQSANHRLPAPASEIADGQSIKNFTDKFRRTVHR